MAGGVLAEAHEKKQSKDLGQGLKMEFSVAYLDPWGHTVADAGGIHYYHDRLSLDWGINPPLVNHESKILPSQYWGSYPLYYTGQTMHYTIRLTNAGNRKLKRLTVVAIQEFLNTAGQIGVRIGSDAVRDWFIAKLEKGESVTLEGSIAIPSTDIESGLDQTHIQVFKSKKGEREGADESVDEGERQEARHHNHGHENAKKTDRLIFEDIQAGIWCPPSGQPVKP